MRRRLALNGSFSLAIMAAIVLAVFGGTTAIVSQVVFAPPATAQNHNNTNSQLNNKSLALTADGALLVVANPDSHSISLVDTNDLSVVGEIQVGQKPRSIAITSAGLAYVANQGSNTISVVDLATNSVIKTVLVGDRPVSLVLSPDERFLVVGEYGDDSIRFLETKSHSTVSTRQTDDRPYGLSFTPDGQYLLVSHLLSGQIMKLRFLPYINYIPALGPGSGGDTVYPMEDSTEPVVSRIATSLNVAPAAAVLVNGGGTRAYLPQTTANGLGLNTQFDTTLFPKIAVLNLTDDSHEKSENISLPETDRPVGLPWDVALARDDQELWIVNAASNDISVINISGDRPRRAGHISVENNPRGIIITSDGETAFVNNTLSGTVSVIDTVRYSVTDTINVTEIPLPPLLLRGKQLFYSSADPEIAQAAWISCNSCHIEGEHDGRTWLLQFLGQIPAGASPVITRNTTSLLGMVESYPLRWSAEWDESADSEFSVRFEQFGTGLIRGEDMHLTLGQPNQGRSADLDALATFIDSLAIPQRNRTMTPAELRGQNLFESSETACLECHPPPIYSDFEVHDVGTADGPGEWFGPLIDTPTLRFLHDSAPYLHDGSAPTLLDVLTSANPQDEHGKTSHLTQQELADLVAYLEALPVD